MKKAFKFIGGLFMILTILTVIFFVAALPGMFIKPETWIGFAFCMSLFLVVFFIAGYFALHFLAFGGSLFGEDEE